MASLGYHPPLFKFQKNKVAVPWVRANLHRCKRVGTLILQKNSSEQSVLRRTFLWIAWIGLHQSYSTLCAPLTSLHVPRSENLQLDVKPLWLSEIKP